MKYLNFRPPGGLFVWLTCKLAMIMIFTSCGDIQSLAPQNRDNQVSIARDFGEFEEEFVRNLDSVGLNKHFYDGNDARFLNDLKVLFAISTASYMNAHYAAQVRSVWEKLHQCLSAESWQDVMGAFYAYMSQSDALVNQKDSFLWYPFLRDNGLGVVESFFDSLPLTEHPSAESLFSLVRNQPGSVKLAVFLKHLMLLPQKPFQQRYLAHEWFLWPSEEEDLGRRVVCFYDQLLTDNDVQKYLKKYAAEETGLNYNLALENIYPNVIALLRWLDTASLSPEERDRFAANSAAYWNKLFLDSNATPGNSLETHPLPQSWKTFLELAGKSVSNKLFMQNTLHKTISMWEKKMGLFKHQMAINVPVIVFVVGLLFAQAIFLLITCILLTWGNLLYMVGFIAATLALTLVMILWPFVFWFAPRYHERSSRADKNDLESIYRKLRTFSNKLEYLLLVVLVLLFIFGIHVPQPYLIASLMIILALPLLLYACFFKRVLPWFMGIFEEDLRGVKSFVAWKEVLAELEKTRAELSLVQENEPRPLITWTNTQVMKSRVSSTLDGFWKKVSPEFHKVMRLDQVVFRYSDGAELLPQSRWHSKDQAEVVLSTQFAQSSQLSDSVKNLHKLNGLLKLALQKSGIAFSRNNSFELDWDLSGLVLLKSYCSDIEWTTFVTQSEKYLESIGDSSNYSSWLDAAKGLSQSDSQDFVWQNSAQLLTAA